MKHLPKHVRPRWRYLAVGIETRPDAELSRHGFQRALWYAAGNLLGDPGSADADLRLLSFDSDGGSGEAVVRVRRDEVASGRAALACVDTVDDTPVRVRVRGISGTVRTAEEKYLGRAAERSVEEDVVFQGQSYRAVRRDGVVDLAGDGRHVGATASDLE